MNRPATALAAAVLLCLSAAAPASAAESYDSCTGFIDSVPATISTQGTWCLRADLATGISTGNAITVAANNVTVDCNGFKLGGLLAGAGTSASGIRADDRLNTTVRNCAVRGFMRGIALFGGASAGNLVEDNRLDQNRQAGIFVQGDANRIQRNRVVDTLGSPNDTYTYGIYAAGDVIDNTVDVVVAVSEANGINANGTGAVVRGNVVRNLDAPANYGINIGSARVVVIGNQAINATNRPGIGIWGASTTVCTHNVASGWIAAGIEDCILGDGNLTP